MKLMEKQIINFLERKSASIGNAFDKQDQNNVVAFICYESFKTDWDCNASEQAKSAYIIAIAYNLSLYFNYTPGPCSLTSSEPESLIQANPLSHFKPVILQESLGKQ